MQESPDELFDLLSEIGSDLEIDEDEGEDEEDLDLYILPVNDLVQKHFSTTLSKSYTLSESDTPSKSNGWDCENHIPLPRFKWGSSNVFQSKADPGYK